MASGLCKQSEFVDIALLPGVATTTCHAGAFGADANHCAGNEPNMTDNLNRKLSATGLLYCKPAQGADTKHSQEYADALAWEILTSLRSWLHRREPQRFGRYDGRARGLHADGGGRQRRDRDWRSWLADASTHPLRCSRVHSLMASAHGTLHVSSPRRCHRQDR